MLRNFAWLLGSASLFIPAAMPFAAQAQQNSTTESDQSAATQGFGDIVVTATRREASLQKVPLSVSAVSADTLTSRNILAITDIATGQVPGVVFQAFGGTVSSAEIAIRGVATNDPDQATRELPVPIYIDGVYLGRGQGSGLQLIDPERVEVLRGPQGTLFGRNAEGGAVQYIARKPTGEFGMDLTGSVGNYDFRRFRGTMNLPELYGFKILLAGLMSDQDGFTKNPRPSNLGFGAVDGIYRQRRDFSERQNVGWRVAVRYDQIDNLLLDYSYDWSRSEDTQAYLTYTGPQIPGAEAPSSSLPDEAPLPLYHAPFITKASGHSFTAAWTVSENVTLKSISSYRKVSKVGYGNLGTSQNLAGAFGLDPTDPDQAIYYIADQDLRQKQYSQEVQFLGSWDRLDLTAGAVYYAERVTQIAHPTFFSGPGMALFGFPDFRPGARTAHRVRTNSLGLYAQATYTPPILDDKLELTAGLRYADDRKTAVRYIGPGDAFGVTEIPLDERVRIAEKRVDPAFTVKYNFSSLANVYLRYAQAYRAGGASIRSAAFLPYGSEVTKAFELGAKLQSPDRRLLVNAALYQNKVHNPQFDVGESPTLSQLTITVNGPIVRTVRGVELEASYRPPIDGLSLSVNYAYMHVKQPPFINPNNPAAGLVNAQILFAPKHSGSVNVDYRVPAGFADFVLHADYSHATKIYNGGEINPVGTVSPTDPVIVRQLNARVSLEKLDIGAGNVSLSFWVKNLLNRDDLVYAFRVPGDNVHSFNYYVDPRTYGVDLRYQF